MMAKTAVKTVELEPIDRLEEKIKALVGMVDRLRAESAHAAEENQRLAGELEMMRSKLAANEVVTAELSTLKEERDVIKMRVSEMLDQLEALNL